jgi:hypothetical protein
VKGLFVGYRREREGDRQVGVLECVAIPKVDDSFTLLLLSLFFIFRDVRSTLEYRWNPTSLHHAAPQPRQIVVTLQNLHLSKLALSMFCSLYWNKAVQQPCLSLGCIVLLCQLKLSFFLPLSWRGSCGSQVLVSLSLSHGIPYISVCMSSTINNCPSFFSSHRPLPPKCQQTTTNPISVASTRLSKIKINSNNQRQLTYQNVLLRHQAFHLVCPPGDRR